MSHRSAARLCSFLMAGLFAVVVVTGIAVAATDPVDLDPDKDLNGNGTADDPFNVTNASELQAMRGNLTAIYQLTGSIDATNTSQWDDGDGFEPVGNATHEFNGSLEGNGFVIKNLTINRNGENDIGLFGFVGRNGNVGQLTNVTLSNVNVTGTNSVGALVGNSTNVLVENVTLTGGSVDGSDAVGGLLGVLAATEANEYRVADSRVDRLTVNGTTNVGGVIGSAGDGQTRTFVKDTTANVTVEGYKTVGGFAGYATLMRLQNVTTEGIVNASSAGNANAGGLVGRFDGNSNVDSIFDSESSATVSATGANAGGLVGIAHGFVTQSVATGNVTGESRVGGLVGVTEDEISSSFATGNVTGESRVGGLVGLVNTSGGTAVSGAYASGSVRATGTSGEYYGGLIGFHEAGDLQNVYAIGTVDGNNNTGGLIGSTNTTGTVSIDKTYAAGSVSGDSNTGGLIGSRNNTDVQDSYWDRARTGQSDSDSGERLQTYDMVGTEADTRMTGFSFTATWETVEASDPDVAADGYPILDGLDREPQLLVPDFDRPEFVSAAITAGAPDEISLEFNTTVTLEGTPPTDGFSVFIDGVGGTINSATANGQTVVLSLDETISAGDLVTVGYNVRRTNLVDADGDEAISFSTNTNNADFENNVGGGGGGGGSGGGGGGGSSDADDRSVDQTVTDDGDTEVTGGSSGDVIEISEETTGSSSSINGLDNIAVDGLSVELATDRDFFINVETYELGEEDELDAVAEATGDTGDDNADDESESSDAAESSITASFERETETVSVGYVTVTHNLEPEDIANATFEFSVRQEYLDDLDVDPENVSLYRQTDQWTSLPTDYRERSFSRYRFEADSPGFSSFAIGTNAPLSIVVNGTLDQAEIVEGETATATATVNNRGQTPVTHTVTLTADSQTVATETVTVGGGEVVDVSLGFEPAAGVYEMAVDDVSLDSLTVVAEESQRPWWLLVVAIAIGLFVAWYRRRDDENEETPTES